MIKTILLKQLESLYQEHRSYLDQWIQKCLSNTDPETDWMERWAEQAKEELEYLEMCQAAWEIWREVSFITREQLLPDGTTFSFRHSPEHNQALLKRIVDLNETFNLNSALSNALILGKWDCQGNHEQWEFKQNEDVFSYEVSQAGRCIEKGTYAFEEGDLRLTPTESSRKSPPPIQLGDKEALLFRKYLFGNFMLKSRWRKLSA